MPAFSPANDGAGALRHRVTFAERGTELDEYGNVSSGWVDRCTVAANIMPLRFGTEAVEAARLAGRQPVTIRVRATPDTRKVTSDWKATDQQGTEYNIRGAVDPFMGGGQFGFYIDLMAESGVPA